MSTERSGNLKVCSRNSCSSTVHQIIQAELVCCCSRSLWLLLRNSSGESCGPQLVIYFCPSEGWRGFSVIWWEIQTSLDWLTTLHSRVIFRGGSRVTLEGTELSWLPLCRGTCSDQSRTWRWAERVFRHSVRLRSTQHLSLHLAGSQSRTCQHLPAKYWECREGGRDCNWWGCRGGNCQCVVSWRCHLSSSASAGTAFLLLL